MTWKQIYLSMEGKVNTYISKHNIITGNWHVNGISNIETKAKCYGIL